MSNFEFSRQFVDVKVPKRSGFDKSFKNLLTTKVGTLTPILCDEVIPNTRVHLKTAVNACLPPLASDTFMNVNLKIEAFFVPSRILYGGWCEWLTGEKVRSVIGSGSNGNLNPVSIPYLTVDNGDSVSEYAPGTLADYLGVKLPSQPNNVGGTLDHAFNIFPFLAYHKIYDEWYRNTQVQGNVFAKTASSIANNYLGNLPYVRIVGTNAQSFSLTSKLADGVELGQLRQRNFDLDYFTTATPNAQIGNPQGVSMSITVPSGGGNVSTGFSIAALRAANSLQQFAERQNLSGFRYVDWVKSNYGANLSDGMAQRPLFLGKQTISVYTKGLVQTQNNTQDSTTTNNPFTTTGANFGRAVIVGNGNLIDDFTAQEHGYIFVMATLVPKVTYATGIRRDLFHYNTHASQSDMANPLLQNTGNQPIYQTELSPLAATSSTNGSTVFGYTDRYAEYMTREDELHGLVRDGESLQSFALQRGFTGNVTMGTNFLEIPTNFMDQVTAVTGDVSMYGTWIDAYFDYKVSMPLAEYSIPSLQDPSYEHGKDVTIKRGGSQI